MFPGGVAVTSTTILRDVYSVTLKGSQPTLTS